MLAILAAASLALAQQTDTTLAVQQGARLDVENFGGEIVVRTWAQDRVRIQATHSSRDWIEISARPSAIHVEAESRRGMPHLVEYQITVPAWMPLQLSGVSTHVQVEGTRAAVRVETVEGGITVTGGTEVTVESVEGDVIVTGARGRVPRGEVDPPVKRDYLRLRISSAACGTTLNRSPTTPKSASSKIGASASLLTATMVLEVCMPARCWIAPEMPSAT